MGNVMDAGNKPRGVYTISVAADMVGMNQQSLRTYELKGLLEPGHTEGSTRLYSDDDVARPRRISELLASGLNVAGIGLVLDLESENESLRRELSRHHGGCLKGH
ncbi:MerR family transcriptional regulator [Paeniglutamicibacter sp. NPDC012692]|uniref:MerR family transcriptional regulator n=1 Tax=Paeniglutamicibacter sp. NPDC012692 TaxID=3364388 RepID=UPI00369D7B38